MMTAWGRAGSGEAERRQTGRKLRETCWGLVTFRNTLASIISSDLHHAPVREKALFSAFD